jgi:flagellar motor switch protein FliM
MAQDLAIRKLVEKIDPKGDFRSQYDQLKKIDPEVQQIPLHIDEGKCQSKKCKGSRRFTAETLETYQGILENFSRQLSADNR